MADEWIKMRHALADDPRVIAIASTLLDQWDFQLVPKASEFCPDSVRKNPDKVCATARIDVVASLFVIGALQRTWSLFDVYTIDGTLLGYSPAALDAKVGLPGWSAAMVAAGWLEVGAQSLVMPRFEKHTSESAKARAKDAARKGKERKKRPNSVRVLSAFCPEKSGQNSEQKQKQKQNRSADQILRSDLKEDPPSKSNGRAKRSAAGSDLKKNAPKNIGAAEIGPVQIERAAPFAAELFARIGYGGVDGAIVWKIALAVESGLGLSRAAVLSAAEGAKLCATKNPLGYFRQTLAETCQAAAFDLAGLLASVKLPRGFATGPPAPTGESAMPSVSPKSP